MNDVEKVFTVQLFIYVNLLNVFLRENISNSLGGSLCEYLNIVH